MGLGVGQVVGAAEDVADLVVQPRSCCREGRSGEVRPVEGLTSAVYIIWVS